MSYKNDKLDEKIGKQIKKHLGKYSQADLCEKLNISSSVLNNYLSGRRSIPYEILIKLTRLLCVSADEMLGIKNHHSKEDMATAAGYTGLSDEAVTKLREITKAPSRKLFLEALIMDDTLMSYLSSYTFSHIPYEVAKSKYRVFPLKNQLHSHHRDIAFASVIRHLPLFAESVEANSSGNFDDLAIEYLRKNGDIKKAVHGINKYFDYEEYRNEIFEPPEDCYYEPSLDEIYEQMADAEKAAKEFEEAAYAEEKAMESLIEILDKVKEQ